MAGTLTISTLSDGTNSTSATNCIRGSAKAWVSFNGATAAIRGSFNVSSVTRSSVGTYQVSFSTALDTVNYSIVGMCADVSTGNGASIELPFGGTYTTSAVALITYQRTGGFIDPAIVNVSVNS